MCDRMHDINTISHETFRILDEDSQESFRKQIKQIMVDKSTRGKKELKMSISVCLNFPFLEGPSKVKRIKRRVNVIHVRYQLFEHACFVSAIC